MNHELTPTSVLQLALEQKEARKRQNPFQKDTERQLEAQKYADFTAPMVIALLNELKKKLKASRDAEAAATVYLEHHAQILKLLS